MIYVGIDLSVNSTAMCVYDVGYILYNYTNKKQNYTWIKNTKDLINFRFFDFEYKDLSLDKVKNSKINFSETLVNKIKDYDRYTNLIINDIKKHDTGNLKIGIEGYNYGLRTTDTIIDLSELGSMVKYKIIKNFPNAELVIIPPKSVKIDTCRMVYKTIDSKKIVRNYSGVAGGSFDKHDMMKAFIESDINNNFKNYVLNHKDELLRMKNIPKPLDDLVDSLFICEIVRNGTF